MNQSSAAFKIALEKKRWDAHKSIHKSEVEFGRGITNIISSDKAMTEVPLRTHMDDLWTVG